MCLLFHPLRGGKSQNLLKVAVVAGKGGKTGQKGNLVDGIHTLKKQDTGFADTETVQIFQGRQGGNAFKNPPKMRLAQMAGICEANPLQ